MYGQGHERWFGMNELHTKGQENYGEVTQVAHVLTAIDLLARTPAGRSGGSVVMLTGGDGAVRPEKVESGFAIELLDDLHCPALVITGGYIGPERRRSDRVLPYHRGPSPSDVGSLRIAWLRRVALTVCITLAFAVPLTLFASRSVPFAPSAASKVAPPPDHFGAKSLKATVRQWRRADAVYRRELAHQMVAEARALGGPVAGAAVPSSPGAMTVPVVSPASAFSRRFARVEASAKARAAAQWAAMQKAAQVRARAQAGALRRATARTARAAINSGGAIDRHPDLRSHASPPTP